MMRALAAWCRRIREIPSPLGAFLVIGGMFALLKLTRPVIPHSVILLYMGFVTVGVLIHITLDDERIRRFNDFFVPQLGEPLARTRLRWGLLAVIPIVAAAWAYDATRPGYAPPVEIFQRHPTVGAEVLDRIEVPVWAADPAKWDDAILSDGKRLYDGNCAVCHGEKLDGQGPAAEGFRYPIRPADFTDAGTIAQLTLPYVYWRLTTGGIQNQFNSAMPRWVASTESSGASSAHMYDLSAEEAWRVIVYLYNATGFEPRTN
ncbi:MAG: c-type cytochrome [Gammaproteobacteria bacterium]|nr:c-type cytochrome [Gammaproteobacteria bacterium]